MNEYGDLLTSAERRRAKASHLRPAVVLLTPVLAILFQVYVPLFFRYLGYLELPLLITIYYALIHRHPLGGLLYGATIGLAQDSLSHHPIGMFGIDKTLVGYFSASLSLRFDVDNPVARFLVALFFYIFHQLFYWVLARALLGTAAEFTIRPTLALAVMNGAVAVPLFHLLDKLKQRQ